MCVSIGELGLNYRQLRPLDECQKRGARVIETELKITLDKAAEAALSAHVALEGLRVRPRQTDELVSTYFDTPDQALARAGIALRLRKIGSRFVQTVKVKDPKAATAHGLFSHVEVEIPAPDRKLVLDGPDAHGVFAAILKAAGDAELMPMFETHVSRIVEHLAAPCGGEVELAIDRGEIIAGEHRAVICEAEIELMSGDVTAVFKVARVLFREGPLRFSTANKAARGYLLAATGTADRPLAARNAGALSYVADTPIETVARDVLRDCFAQISLNMVVVAESEAPEGPHQLRVGLRRLRTALDVLGPSLGGAVIEKLSEKARDFGRVVGLLRDIDVLIGEIVGPETEDGLDAPARTALLTALEKRRVTVRVGVRAALASPEAVDFVLDLMQLVEARGWLQPSDYSQTARLTVPIGAIASKLMDEHAEKAHKKAHKLHHLNDDALHELRKKLKKLRYAAEILDPIYRGKKVTAYVKSLKKLQDTFGSINDAAMAAEYLTGPDAPGRKDPDIQRAVGWVLGRLAAKAGAERPRFFEQWEKFAQTRQFWT